MRKRIDDGIFGKLGLAIFWFIVYEQAINFLLFRKLYVVVPILYYLIEVPFFYVGSFKLWPLWNKGRSSRLKAFLLIVLATILFIFLQYGAGIIAIWYWKREITFDFTWVDVLKTFGRGVYILGLAFFYYLGRRGIQKEVEKNKALQLENDLLKSKVDSHMIFNTMNLAHGIVEEVSQEGAEAIERLSRLMEYALGPSDEKGFVPLEEELKYVAEYVELIKMRKKGQCHIDFKLDMSNAANGLVIPPVILIKMVENVFKHGNLKLEDDPATVEISCVGKMLKLNTYNPLNTGNTPKGFGIGMTSIQQRLDSLYPGKFNLKTIKTETSFYLTFDIEL